MQEPRKQQDVLRRPGKRKVSILNTIFSPKSGGSSSSDANMKKHHLDNKGRKKPSQVASKLKIWFLPKKFETDEQIIFMSPIEKFLKYRKIPNKLIIDVLLCILVTLQIFFLSKNRKSFINTSRTGFIHYFMPPNWDSAYSPPFLLPTTKFLTIEQTQAHIKRVVSKIYEFDMDPVGTYDQNHNDLNNSTDYHNKNLTMHITLRKDNPRLLLFDQTSVTPHEIGHYIPTNGPSSACGVSFRKVVIHDTTVSRESPLGSFLGTKDPVELRKNFDSLVSMDLEFSFKALDVSSSSDQNFILSIPLFSNFFTSWYPRGLIWTIQISLQNYFNSGQLTFVVFARYKYWLGPQDQFQHSKQKTSILSTIFSNSFRITTFLAVGIFALSLMSFFLVLRALGERGRLFIKKKRQLLAMRKKKWGKLKLIGFRSELRFFFKGFTRYVSPWFFVSLLKDWINCLSVLMSFFFFMGLASFDYFTNSASSAEAFSSFSNWGLATDSVETLVLVFLGFGAFLTFFNMVRYLNYYSRTVTLYITFARSLPVLFQFSVSVVILFSAFGLAGSGWFGWMNGNFLDVVRSFEMLFALIIQDSVIDQFLGTHQYNWFYKLLSRCFNYIFIVLFAITAWRLIFGAIFFEFFYLKNVFFSNILFKIEN